MKLKIIIHSLSLFVLLSAGMYLFSNCSSSTKFTDRQSDTEKDREEVEKTKGTEDEISRRRRSSSRSSSSRSRRSSSLSPTPTPSFDCTECQSPQRCNTDESACVRCTENSHCTSPLICSNDECVQPCPTECSNTQVCNPSSRECEDRETCSNDSDCPSEFPKCSSDNVCVECNEDGDCSGKGPERDACSALNVCVACVPNASGDRRGQGCPDDKACKLGGTCVECLIDNHCSGSSFGDRDHCNSLSNTCVECTGSSHCDAGEVCTDGECTSGTCGGCHNPCNDSGDPVGPLGGVLLGVEQNDDCWGNLAHLIANCPQTPNWLKDTNNFCSYGYESIKIESNGSVTWYSGYFRGKEGYSGNEGYSGRWVDGTFRRGSMRNTLWENGTFESGVFLESKWKDGTWTAVPTRFEDITFIKAGSFCGGIWEGGTWEGGDFYNGRFIGGTWEDGTWHAGQWGSQATWITGIIRRGGGSLRGPSSSPPSTSTCDISNCNSSNNCHYDF